MTSGAGLALCGVEVTRKVTTTDGWRASRYKVKGRTRRIWDHPALEDDDVVGDGLFYVAYSVESGETTEVMAENCRVLDVNSSNLVGVCMAEAPGALFRKTSETLHRYHSLMRHETYDRPAGQIGSDVKAVLWMPSSMLLESNSKRERNEDRTIFYNVER